jgi:hypothetical protein
MNDEFIEIANAIIVDFIGYCYWQMNREDISVKSKEEWTERYHIAYADKRAMFSSDEKETQRVFSKAKNIYAPLLKNMRQNAYPVIAKA